MRRPIITAMAAIAVSAAVGGCSDITNHWPGQLGTPTNPPQSRPQERYKYSRAKAATAAPREDKSPDLAVAPPTAAAPAAPVKTTVTLADEEAIKSRAEKVLNESDTRLAKIDRSRLSAEDASTYQQAAGLADAARKALERRDYVVASGLAEKAFVLAQAVASKTSSP